jgi:hemerythrin
MRFLEEYVVVHFGTEERYMDTYGYPMSAEHKREHEKFNDNLAGLKKQLEAEGPALLVLLAANRLLVDWMRNHIMCVDQQLGAFLKTRGAE